MYLGGFSMQNCYITNKIKSFFSNNISLLKLSLSFFTVGIFFSFLSFPTLDNTRAYIGSIFLALWFLSAPFLDPEKRDRIMIELCKLVVFLLISSILLFYFVKTLNHNTHVIWDLAASLASLAVSYYLISCLLSIINVFKLIFKKVYTYLFNSSSDDSPLKIFTKNISAFFITISGFLATLVAVVTSIKTIIDTINK